MSTKEQIAEFLTTEFPQTKCTVESITKHGATVRHEVGFNELRPGNTVSGPVLMEVADCTLYVAILAEIGIVPLAVTTNLNINFMRMPPATKDIIGECKLLKVGKTLIVGEVSLYSEGDDDAVAHAVGTYAVPRT